MNTRHAWHALAALALTVALAPVAFADPPADKGRGASGASQSADRGHDRHDDAGNRGQVVSECNHRANEKKLKGKGRKDYVEWCTDRGERHHYDDRRYSEDRACYRKADARNLSGDLRRAFIAGCLRRQESSR